MIEVENNGRERQGRTDGWTEERTEGGTDGRRKGGGREGEMERERYKYR